MDEDRRLTLFLLRVLIYMVMLVCAYLVLQQLAVVVAPVGVALVLAFLLDPSVRALEVRGVPRWLAVVMLVLGFLGCIAGLSVALPHLVAKELERFVARLPEYAEVINKR